MEGVAIADDQGVVQGFSILRALQILHAIKSFILLRRGYII